jgi:hypothetical protein
MVGLWDEGKEMSWVAQMGQRKVIPMAVQWAHHLGGYWESNLELTLEN